VDDPNPSPFPTLLVNEVAPNEADDYIELYNPANTAVDISGWFLSDDENDPKKYEIPKGTSISAQVIKEEVERRRKRTIKGGGEREYKAILI
jgi:hypothetical protein